MDRTAITTLLVEVGEGLPGAEDRLFKVIYAELKRRARLQLYGGPINPAYLSPTTLVHETYIRLLGNERRSRPDWENEKHFYFCITRAMRDILIEVHRRNSAKKRGENVRPAPIPDDLPDRSMSDPLELAEAVDALKASNPSAAMVAELRIFAGLNHADIARMLGMANSTVRRHWKYATGFLSDRLNK